MNERVLPKQSFLNHISELRVRLLWILLGLFIGTLIGYNLYNSLINILLSPLKESVYYTSPAGGFSFIIQISLLFGFLFSLPLFIYHLYKFLQPAFPDTAQKKIVLFILCSIALMFVGVLFAYYICLPTALHFLGEYDSKNIHSLISANEYFSFVNRYIIGFALLFQFPLFLLIINKIFTLRTRMLLMYQRHIIALCFIIAAALSPTVDMFNMTVMAIPMILLYYISVFLVFLVNSRRKKITPSPKKYSKVVIAFDFVLVMIVSFLVGVSVLFSYAAFQNIKNRQTISVQNNLIIPRAVINPASVQ